MIEITGHDEIDDGVPQILQPFVILEDGTGVFVQIRAMGQGAREQRIVAELHAQPLAQFQ